MKTCVISLFICLFAAYGCAQDNGKTKTEPTPPASFIKNKKIRYSIVMMACDTCAPIRNLGYRVVVELDQKEQDLVKGIKPETWLDLLKMDSADFAANLILYQIHGKDAFLLYQNNSKELWRKYLKAKDMIFWTKELKK